MCKPKVGRCFTRDKSCTQAGEQKTATGKWIVARVMATVLEKVIFKATQGSKSQSLVWKGSGLVIFMYFYLQKKIRALKK